MSEPTTMAAACVTRRSVMLGAAGVAGAAAMVAMSAQAQAASQVAQKSVQYQDKPKGKNQCDGCSLFIAPAACKQVEGVISPNGWCMLYRPKAA